MRPLELLSKIEESAGTALYETRRKETVSALNKKDIKLKEIDYLLEKQIQPDLEKIKKDEVNNKKMAALTEEMDKFATFSEIFKYIQLDEDLKNGDSDLAKNQASIEDQEEELKKLKQEKVDNETKLKVLIDSNQGEQTAELKQIEEDYNKKKKDLTNCEGDIQNAQKAIDTGINRLA